MKRFAIILTITAILGFAPGWSATFAGDEVTTPTDAELPGTESLQIETIPLSWDWLAERADFQESNEGGKTTPRGSAKSGSVNCGGGDYCPAGYSCCQKDSAKVCCDENYPHWCKATGYCYRYIDDANAACGSDWTVCFKPADP